MRKYYFIIVSLLFLNQPILSQWFAQNSGTTQNLRHIIFVNQTTGWFTDGYRIYKTTNGGISWFNQLNQSTFTITDIKFFNEYLGFMTISLGYPGGIYRTTNGGVNWQLVHYNNYLTLWEIKFVNSEKILVLGHAGAPVVGALLETNDAGNTWDHRLISLNYFDLIWSIDIINELEYVISAIERIFKTTNGGLSWSEISLPGMFEIPKISFKDFNNGWIRVSHPASDKLYRSTDGGATWNLQADSITTFYFVDLNTGWYIHKNNIFKTINGGTTWEPQNSNTPHNLNNIFFLDHNKGWIVGNSGTLLYTPNGGVPVELVSFSASVLNGNVYLNWITSTEVNNHGFEILRSEKTAFDNWNVIGFVDGYGTTTEVQNYSYTDLNPTPGSYRYKLKQIDYDGSFEYSDAVEIEIPAARTFALEQNYPNPFNPATTIKYQVPAASLVKINIYDAAGRVIKELLQEEKDPGSYSIIWDGRDENNNLVSSGIYFYRLQAGEIFLTKKLILLR